MSILLGIRVALAGGREAVVRMTLMAIGVTVGVVLLLLSLSGLPILQSHIDRLAWHRTDAFSPTTAPDPALWLAVTDRYDGRDVIRVHVAALGPRPPVPPGVERLPGPGEVVVSPALARLMRTVPEDQLRNRFPGQIVGTIGPEVSSCPTSWSPSSAALPSRCAVRMVRLRSGASSNRASLSIWRHFGESSLDCSL
jgi:hypothetical protein